MSVKIRLKRIGRKKQPTYRIVVTESRNPPAGNVIETIGYYSPYLKIKPLKLDLEKVEHWMGKGAIPSDAVKKLIRRRRQIDSGVLTEDAVPKKKVKAEKPKGEEAASVEPTAEASEEAPAESEAVEEKPAEESETGTEASEG